MPHRPEGSNVDSCAAFFRFLWQECNAMRHKRTTILLLACLVGTWSSHEPSAAPPVQKSSNYLPSEGIEGLNALHELEVAQDRERIELFAVNPA